MSEEKVQKQTRFEKLTMIAKNTKESLIRNWKENGGCFVDKDKMTKPGIMAEVSGLTSLLLFLIAFNEEKDIVNEDDREIIREIHRVSFSKICSWVKEVVSGRSEESLSSCSRNSPVVLALSR